MAKYDQNDFLQRMLSVVPISWFNFDYPLLISILSAYAAVYAQMMQQIIYLKKQMRISTADMPFLILMMNDFLGGRLPPRYKESANTYRARLKANILRLRNSVAAYISVIFDLTGRIPIVLEGFNAGDTNYLNGGLFLNDNKLGSDGCAQLTIIVYRPLNNTTNTDGLNNQTYSLNAGIFLGDSTDDFIITDDDIRQAIESVRTAGVKVHLIFVD